jgi:hypothetical protein
MLVLQERRAGISVDLSIKLSEPDVAVVFAQRFGRESDRGSLIFDLIEEFRAPFGDRLVLGMLGRDFQPHLGRAGKCAARFHGWW